MNVPSSDVPVQPPFHLLLLRHGQTDANATGVLQGHQPTPLNALGRRQAARLAERVARHRPGVTGVVSSDLLRAAQTAEAVAAACALSPVFDPAWRERGFGELEGKTVGERETWRAAHGDTHPPGGESVDAFRARVKAALESIPAMYANGTVAVITHGGPIGVILRMLSDGTRPASPRNEPVDLAGAANCSVLELVYEPAPAGGFAWRVSCLNDVRHLEGLVTDSDSG